MSRSPVNLQAQLTKIARTLPTGASLTFRVHPDHLWLEILELPITARGQGSAVLARILSEADRAGVPTALLADPTDRPGDPGSFELARWYKRFGFHVLSATEDGVAMERPVDRRCQTPEQILREATRAKAFDLTRAEFDEIGGADLEAAAREPARALRF